MKKIENFDCILWLDKELKNHGAIFLFSLFFLFHLSYSSLKGEEGFRRDLKENWYIQNTSKVDEQMVVKGELIKDQLIETRIPITVMQALVNAGVYEDVYYGLNLEKVDKEQFETPWWFVNEFNLSKNDLEQFVQLHFEGINYKAEIYLNGDKIGDTLNVINAFRRFDFPVTEKLKEGNNRLAIKIFPPRAGDFSTGFVDWNPTPPDNNMGLWREVYLSFSKGVSIVNPFVQSKINYDDMSQASLKIKAQLRNDTDKEIKGILKGEIGEIVFQQEVKVAGNEIKELCFSPRQFSQLNITDAKLWWPHNLGTPHLYQLDLKFYIDGELSSKTNTQFGIREIREYVNDEEHRGVIINGHKVLIKGGGWVDDMLLGDTKEKIEAQIKYTKQMNLNTIRLEGFWGTDRSIYELCDKHGILTFVGWSCHWEWEGYLGVPVPEEYLGIQEPKDIEMMSKAWKDQILWLRNHPSLFGWMMASDKIPVPQLEKNFRKICDEYDGTRAVFLSAKDQVSTISGPSGIKMRGPYAFTVPNYWYVDKNNGGAFGFNSETGPGAQVPPLESLRKMFPEENLWPIDSVWKFHCGRHEFHSLDRYKTGLFKRYGECKSVEEFAFFSQIMNYELMRPMFEAFAVNRHRSTGIIQWMLNSAWPELFWQLYDWYLMPNGAFFGARTACRSLHLAYRYGFHDVYVVNEYLNYKRNLTAKIKVLDLQSKEIYYDDISFDIPANQSQEVIHSLPSFDDYEGNVFFLSLKLFNDADEEIDNNFYWLAKKDDVNDFDSTKWFYTPLKEYADYTDLRKMDEVELKSDIKRLKENGEGVIEVTLHNPGDKIAFFIELMLKNKEQKPILPVYWDDNYISLLPGEKRTVRCTFNLDDCSLKNAKVQIKGLNLKK